MHDFDKVTWEEINRDEVLRHGLVYCRRCGFVLFDSRMGNVNQVCECAGDKFTFNDDVHITYNSSDGSGTIIN